jgi:hypothetical protein
MRDSGMDNPDHNSSTHEYTHGKTQPHSAHVPKVKTHSCWLQRTKYGFCCIKCQTLMPDSMPAITTACTQLLQLQCPTPSQHGTDAGVSMGLTALVNPRKISALTSGHGSGSFRLGSSAWRLNQYAAATAPATVSRMGILHVGPLQAICLQAECNTVVR